MSLLASIVAAAAFASAFACAMKAAEKARESTRWWNQVRELEDSFQKINCLSTQLAYACGALNPFQNSFASDLFIKFVVDKG